jgi:hypothetical protein
METGTMAVEIANATDAAGKPDRVQQGVAVGKVMAAVVDVVITMSESMGTLAAVATAVHWTSWCRS